MLNISKVSFMKRAVSVLTASMVLLSGIVLTVGPASASTTETVPYTYTVKVPVTKTVYEWQVTKTKIGTRTVYAYQKVAKTKTEYRIETRTGYREAPVKVADKPAAAQYKVQVADTASFQTLKKEILVTPSAPGTNKVNLASQLAGNVGDTTYVRVVAKNAAGKSTPGKASKLTFGEVSRSNYTVDVPYTAYRQVSVLQSSGYWHDYITEQAYDQWYIAGYAQRKVNVPAVKETYQVKVGTEQYVIRYDTETYRNGSRSVPYDCGYYQYVWKVPKWISKTCYTTEPVYSTRKVPVYGTRNVYETRTRTLEAAYSYYENDYNNPIWDYWTVPAVWGSRWIDPVYVTGQQAYTAYTTEGRVAITNGWKAATN